MNNSKLLLNNKASSRITRKTPVDAAPNQNQLRRKRIIRLYLTAVVLLGMMFTVYIWQSTKMVEIKLRISKIKRNTQNLQNHNADLRAEISKLQSLSRIESVAKTQLGMIVPKKLCYISMPKIKETNE